MLLSVRRWLLALAILPALGFDWPSRGAQLVSALTAAETARDRRDALRRSAELDPPLAAEAIRTLLTNSDPDVRVEALRLFCRVPADATEELVAAFGDQAPEVRVVAMSELGSRAEPAHTPLLLRGAADPDPRVRSASLRALAGNLDEAAFAALVAALADPAIEVRSAAVEGLAARREPEAHAALLRAFEGALPELRTAILDALGGELASQSALTLALALDDPDEQVVLAALRSYARSSGHPPGDRVAALTSSASPQVADAARRLLARSATAPAATPEASWLPALERTARRSLSVEQSGATLDELERTLPAGETLAADALLEWLARAPTALRRRIVALIARSAAELATSAIVPLLADAEPTLRRALVALLGQSHDAAAPIVLEQTLDDPDPHVREAAGQLLAARLDQRLVARLVARLDGARDTARDELTRILADGLAGLARPLAPAQQEELCDVLITRRTRDARSEALALRVLGTTSHACARQHIRKALSDPRVGVRIAALRASVRDHGARARMLRQQALDHPDPGVASTALIAATLAADPLKSARLRGLLAREHWPLGPAVAFALASTAVASTFSADELCRLRASPEPATRSNALVALARHASRTCPHAPPERLLATSSAWPVRHAAAMWARTREAEAPRAAIARCREREPDAHVRAACMGVQNLPTSPLPADHARALVLDDARVLISWPDGSGNVAWPGLRAIASLPAWFAPYMRE